MKSGIMGWEIEKFDLTVNCHSVWTETQWPVCGLRPSSQCVDRDPVASVWTVRPRPYGQCVFCQTETQLPVCGLSDQDSVNVEY